MVHTFLVAAQLSLAMLMDCLQEFEACALELESISEEDWKGLYERERVPTPASLALSVVGSLFIVGRKVWWKASLATRGW